MARKEVEPDKVAELKSLILDLHGGVDPEVAKARFNAVVNGRLSRGDRSHGGAAHSGRDARGGDPTAL